MTLQRYIPTFFQTLGSEERWAGMREDSQDGAWYEAAEVDRRIKALEAALRELLDSTRTPIPSFEAGKAAQDAWADRRAKARNDAASLLTALETGAKHDT